MKHRTTLLATAVATLTSTLAACSSVEDKPTAAPAYQITRQDSTGNQRVVSVEVDTIENLRAVFGDVAAKLDEEAGYFVETNCSTSGTETSDNRLANGKKAVGSIGQQRPGWMTATPTTRPTRAGPAPRSSPCTPGPQPVRSAAAHPARSVA